MSTRNTKRMLLAVGMIFLLSACAADYSSEVGSYASEYPYTYPHDDDVYLGLGDRQRGWERGHHDHWGDGGRGGPGPIIPGNPGLSGGGSHIGGGGHGSGGGHGGH